MLRIPDYHDYSLNELAQKITDALNRHPAATNVGILWVPYNAQLEVRRCSIAGCFSGGLIARVSASNTYEYYGYDRSAAEGKRLRASWNEATIYRAFRKLTEPYTTALHQTREKLYQIVKELERQQLQPLITQISRNHPARPVAYKDMTIDDCNFWLLLFEPLTRKSA